MGAVNGLAMADEQDREVWFVTGTPSGKELTEAAARVVDELASEIRAATGQRPAAPRGAAPAPLVQQQPRGELRQFPRDVERGTLGDHVEPFWQKLILW
jgi:hypothetical protein